MGFDRLALAVQPEDLGVPGRGADQPEQEADSRRLACPVWTEVAHDLAFGHLEVEIFERVESPYRLDSPSVRMAIVPIRATSWSSHNLGRRGTGTIVRGTWPRLSVRLRESDLRYAQRVIHLHLHSTCSDGLETPERVVELPVGSGCTAMALTDHDGLVGVVQAGARAASLGIGFVPGCEVSCSFEPGTMHALAYFVEPGEGRCNPSSSGSA